MSSKLNRAGRRLAAEAADQAASVADEARTQAIEALGGHPSHFWAHLGWLALGAALGAGLTYLFDPDRGRRRQALLRDQAVHVSHVVAREVPRKLNYAQGVIQGVQHNLGLPGSGAAAGGSEQSPQWETAHNDDGALTAPTT